mmetsp:Transcript_108402/g.198583  ORF Transcript_108402/g.198583 Transcript_108402/m.198583 type:complete len:2435 (-) Transcript_108402:256-7560(-)
MPVWDQIPKKQGLYDPRCESDACGVGAVMDLQSKTSRKILTDARDMVVRMTHRGAKQANENDGDGVGILMSIPDDYFREVCSFPLPPAGAYGVGNLFLPCQEERRHDFTELVERMAEKFGLRVLGWRMPLPVNSAVLGPYARSTEPYIAQVFVGELAQGDCDSSDNEVSKPESRAHSPNFRRQVTGVKASKLRSGKANAAGLAQFSGLSLECRLFLMRRTVSLRARELFICSLSSRTIVYKGQFKPNQLFEYYLDLASEKCTAYLALVHSRFSTNSFPSWSRAHPFRRIAHNGEINTVEGNRNQARAREGLMQQSEIFAGLPLETIFPIDEDIGSDSSMLDNVVELLTAAGNRDLAEIMMMVIPEPWQNSKTMPPEKRAFYKYHSCLMEPWDGPAFVGFTDGRQFGATLDRNGLRPGRYYMMTDGRLILASEVGVVDVVPEEVKFKGRLRPGRMLLVDFREGRLIEDSELKMRYANRFPYSEYLGRHSIEVENLLHPEPEEEKALVEELLEEEGAEGSMVMQQLLPLLRLFGYTYEKMDMLISPMARNGHEPLGSMGQDMPLACLSRLPRQAFDYFVQLFAQATNPPIDPIREANVMSLICPIGPERNLLSPAPESCRRVFLDEPILCQRRFAALLELEDYPHAVLDITYACNENSRLRRADRAITGRNLLKERLDQICKEAVAAITGDGASILVLSHRHSGEDRVPVNSLLAVGALHHHLIAARLRTAVAIVVEAADTFEIHHHCLLLGFGADAIYPYLCYLSLLRVRSTELSLQQRIANYRSAVHEGLLKVMSKMGISCLQSYKGAQLFQALGLGKDVIKHCFGDCRWVLDGVGFEVFAQDALRMHKTAFPSRRQLPPTVDEEVEELDDPGEFHFRSIHDSEMHTNTPDVIMKLQEAARSNSKEGYRLFAEWQDKITEQTEIRGQLEFCMEMCTPVPVHEVEPASEIVKRFCTGAASYGSISDETHRAMAVAMNRMGGRSNTGEGGEDEARFPSLKEAELQVGSTTWKVFDGDSARSKIKQVASGRFGVTAHYLSDADEIQIKLAQGAKPGEGGELPGSKIVGKIAETRLSTPGVGLVSPPPHHDMYSIEDVAQLISDLKNANPSARISVKLVSRIGVGVIASGIVKAKADHLTISGMSGGTGAAKWTSIKHTGLPWEIGVAETHQTLVLNGLRNRVVIQTDGQIRTGRDVVMSALLGAEEIALTTAPLITLGCIMMRKCHLNTCPVGVATQDPELRKKFTGQPEHLINYLFMLAEEVREIMASLGMTKFNELIGRTDLLRPKGHLKDNPKTADLDFSELLKPAWTMESLMVNSSGGEVPMHCCVAQDHELAHQLDNQLVKLAAPALETQSRVVIKDQLVRNVDRSVGCTLSFEVSKKFGGKGLPNNTITVGFKGPAGQSFGAFLAPGVTLQLEGDANDYIGKGLSGGHIVVYPSLDSHFNACDNIIAGNAALYGATGGRAFMAGVAAERFAVRNSGALAVIEGVGDHGCEYMTRGMVVVLGSIGSNFAAGMSGGIAYVLDLSKDFVNLQTVSLDVLSRADELALQDVLEEHVKRTGSVHGQGLLENWSQTVLRFTKVFPKEYRKVIRSSIKTLLSGKKSQDAERILQDFKALMNPLPERRQASKASVSTFRALDLAQPAIETGSQAHNMKRLLATLGISLAPVDNAQRDQVTGQSVRCAYLKFRMRNQSLEECQRLTKIVMSRSWEQEQDLRKRFPRAWTVMKASADGIPVARKDAAPKATAVNLGKQPARDMEDLVPAKLASVANADKRKGFHEYARKALPYRDSKDRTLDWEEIYSSQTKKSQQWHNWMTTQTARCMDCGTPTCHYPNQGGGGCPLGNRIPTWNQLVHEGDWKRALERLLDTNNFPEFTGTTCPAPCEEACVLGINEKPVAIKSVELSIIEYGFSKGWIKPQPPADRTGRKVTIIGSGPAGLAAAQQLNRAGHTVTVIERADRPGGLLMYGIPSMKLDKSKVLRRTEILEHEGVEIKCNVEIGRDVSLWDLHKQNDAVVMATGATQCRDMLSAHGRSLGNVVQAMDFLGASQKANMDADCHPTKGPSKSKQVFEAQDKNVIVIGGGDTAVDCVGTALRLGAKSVLQFSRRDKTSEQRPKHTPWPCWADTYRVDYAHAENTAIHGRDPREYLVVTKAFVPSAKDPSMVGAVRAAKMTTRGSESGEVVDYPADIVILAMGFTGPDEVIDPGRSLWERDEQSNVKAAYGDYRVAGSPFTNVFACGDCRRGASLVVTAIAEGRDCASRVDEFLMGETILPRSAPLAANPTFYQMPQPGMVTAGPSSRLRSRRHKEAKVSEAFERGLISEPKVQEIEIEAVSDTPPQSAKESTLKTSMSRTTVPGSNESLFELPSVSERGADLSVAGVKAQENQVADNSNLRQSSDEYLRVRGQVPTWLAASFGGLLVLNAALVVALSRAQARR